ncbi:MAG: hypothetical protein PVG60_09200 [Desulfarculaceae bacterium]|jgi:hypothetical protein
MKRTMIWELAIVPVSMAIFWFSGHSLFMSNDLGPFTNQIYKERCGDCHSAFHPGLLPAESWRKIMTGLDNHFGEQVDMGEPQRHIISNFLISHAAEHTDARLALNILWSLDGRAPLRITEIPYIRHKHENKGGRSIGSYSNCAACHREAAAGVFNDDEVRPPDKKQMPVRWHKPATNQRAVLAAQSH